VTAVSGAAPQGQLTLEVNDLVAGYGGDEHNQATGVHNADYVVFAFQQPFPQDVYRAGFALLQGVGDVEDDGQVVRRLAHHAEAEHVDDQVVVAGRPERALQPAGVQRRARVHPLTCGGVLQHVVQVQPLRNTSPPLKLLIRMVSCGSGMSKYSPYISSPGRTRWSSMP